MPAVNRLLAELAGPFDSALKTGNAVGTIIEIAARMSQDKAALDGLGIEGAKGKYIYSEDADRTVTETFTGTASRISSLQLYGAEGSYARQTDADGRFIEIFHGTASGYDDSKWRQFWSDNTEQIIQQPDATPQQIEAGRSFIAALESGAVERRDMSTMGVTSSIEVFGYGVNGRVSSGGWNIKTEGIDAFLETYTERRGGQMYDKATGKHATYGQSGSKFEYFVW